MAYGALKRGTDPLSRLAARLDRWCYIKKGGGGKGPPAPDPAVQVAQESAANRYNVSSPFGSQNWTRGQDAIVGYDGSGRPIKGTTWTQNIDLNDSEQRQYDSRNQIAEAMMAQAQRSTNAGAPGYSNRPNMPQMPRNLSNPRDPQQFSPNQADPGTFSPNQGDPGSFSLNQSTPDAAKAHYSRIAEALDPTFERQTRGFEQRMSNSGLPVGSEAYNDAFGEMLTQQNRQLGDAAYEAAERAPELALAERGQQMSDRGQVYGEGLNTRQQQMSDRGQLYGEGLNTRQQQMSDRGQLFSEDLAAQQDARTGYSQSQSEQTRVFDEDLARRQQYHNEIASLLGGQQLNPINGGGGGGNAPLDVGGAFNAYNQSQLARYNAQQGQQANMMSGMFNLGGAALGNWGQIFSDERLKDGIEEIGELPTGESLYEYHYKWEDESEPKHVGVMAQELERTQPDAVTMDPSGYRKVDYRKVIARALADMPLAA